MRITDIHFKKMTFTFNEPFKIAFAVISGYDTLVLKIETDEGIVGYGEAAPLGFVTGDNLDTALTIGKEYRELLIGKDPIAIAEIHRIMDSCYAGNTSVKAAIDMACYDIMAKKMGVPLWRFLGGSCPELVTDVTLGIDTPEKAEKLEVGPTISSPGPMLLKQEATAVKLVVREKPSREIRKTNRANSTKYVTM